jgi:phosphoglycerate kinase
MKKRTVKECDVKSKRVLLRTDFNVPVDENLEIGDTTKIDLSLETIKYLSEQKAKTIIISHIGRPEGRYQKKYSLYPVKEYLEKALRKNVSFAESVIGKETEELIEEMLPGDILLLENVRFEPDEIKNASSFAKKLASYGDVFVLDAFASAHRNHASVTGISKYLESYAGFLLDNELDKLSSIFERIERPLTVVLGGSKIDDNLNVIRKFASKVDNFIIGGELAGVFYPLMGYDVEEVYFDKELTKLIREAYRVVNGEEEKFHFPKDVIVTDKISEESQMAIIPLTFIHKKLKPVDIGPKSIKEFCSILERSSTVIWNGPLGLSDYVGFLKGTKEIAEFIQGLYGKSIVGGVETLKSLKMLGLSLSRFTHASTAGGAMLDYLQKGNLPGLEGIPKVWGV